MSLIVLTIIGPDRPGLVELVAETVTTHKGNWMASRMAHLGGKFAGIVQIDVADDEMESLLADLAKLSQHGLNVYSEPDVKPASSSKTSAVILELVGGDRPGIVKTISHILTQNNVNVEELNTEYVPAPMTGENLFRISAQLKLPTDLQMDVLKQQLEAVSHDLMVDISINP